MPDFEPDRNLDSQPETLNPTLRFETLAYQADGGCPSLGAFFTLLVTTFGAVMLGTVASFIGQWLYLVFLFPIGLGLALGFLARFGVDKGKVRSRACGMLAGYLGGCLLILSMHYADYQRMLGELKELEAQLGAELDARVALQGVSFPEYINTQAEHGVTLTRATHGDRGINLGYYGSLIYWLLEMGLVGFIAELVIRDRLKRPFCTTCQSWKVEQKFDTPPLSKATLLHAVTTGEIGSLVAENYLPSPDGTLELTAYECPVCGADGSVEIKLTETTKNAKGQPIVNELATISYPGEALRVFEDLFTLIQLSPARERGASPGGQQQDDEPADSETVPS